MKANHLTFDRIKKSPYKEKVYIKINTDKPDLSEYEERVLSTTISDHVKKGISPRIGENLHYFSKYKVENITYTGWGVVIYDLSEIKFEIPEIDPLGFDSEYIKELMKSMPTNENL